MDLRAVRMEKSVTMIEIVCKDMLVQQIEDLVSWISENPFTTMLLVAMLGAGVYVFLHFSREGF